MSFPAKYSGTCAVCGKRYAKGAMIDSAKSQHGTLINNYRHAECAQLDPQWWSAFVAACETMSQRREPLVEAWMHVARRYLGDDTDYRTAPTGTGTLYQIERTFGDKAATFLRVVSLSVDVAPNTRDFSLDVIDGIKRTLITVKLQDATIGKSASYGAGGTSVRTLDKRRWAYYLD